MPKPKPKPKPAHAAAVNLHATEAAEFSAADGGCACGALRFRLTREPMFVQVPTDSGNRHWVARCAQCRTALWNEHGSRQAITRYVRVGTLDEPARFPPRAHIYGRSMQPWLRLNDLAAPVFDQYYDAATVWPAAGLARYASSQAAKVANAAERRAAPGKPAKA